MTLEIEQINYLDWAFVMTVAFLCLGKLRWKTIYP